MNRSGPTCHFVWTGRCFPYHCRLAVESAIVAMPDSSVRLHVIGEFPDTDDFRAVAAQQRVVVERCEMDDVLDDLPVGRRTYLDVLRRIPPAAASAISNLVRLAVLYRHGGIYLDTDVIVIRGLHDPDLRGAFVGVEQVWALNRRRIERGISPTVAVCSIPWAARKALTRLDSKVAHGHWRYADRLGASSAASRLQVNNAVIGAPAGSPFIELALRRAVGVDPCRRFALGPHLLDDVANEAPRSVHLVPPSRFYAIPPGQSHRCFDDRHVELPVDAQVIHYVQSNHRALLAELAEDDSRFTPDGAPFWRLGHRVQCAMRTRTSQDAGR